MSSQKISKLNKLLNNSPTGAVITQQWLTQLGISRQLANRYVQSNWLARLGRGAYIRSGSSAEWNGALYAIQSQLNLSVFPGAYTALKIKGFGQFAPLSKKETIFLFSNGSRHLPNWFSSNKWGGSIKHCSAFLFSKEISNSNITVEIKGLPVNISTPEKAIFEILYLTGNNAEIDYALQLMEGLTTLRPSLLQLLLENCRYIKVKRLFLWMAETIGHAWYDQLNTDKINLGTGKRSLYKGGLLNEKYLITVPKKENMPYV